MSEWVYIVGAYTLTYVVLAGYALRLRSLRRGAVAPVHLEEGEGNFDA
jgi:hypothetical protein